MFSPQPLQGYTMHSAKRRRSRGVATGELEYGNYNIHDSCLRSGSSVVLDFWTAHVDTWDMGASKAPTQAPSVRRRLQPRWIYASDTVANPSNPSNSSRLDQETRTVDDSSPRVPSTEDDFETATPAPPSPKRTPFSLITRFAGWLFSKFSITTRPQSSPKPGTKRGGQVPIAARPVPPRPLTELAIASLEGLKVYKYNPSESGSAGPQSRASSQDDEDYLYHSPCSSPVGTHGVRYESIKRDTSMILHHIRKLGFHETPADLTPPLARQLGNYLLRAPDDQHEAQIRWLILTGHNSNECEFKISDQIRCRWARLREMLGGLPAGVVTVVVLACCQAEDAMSGLVDGSEIPGLILIASSERNEVSRADTLQGDYFLHAMLTVLEAKSLGQTAHTWEGLLAEIMHELKIAGVKGQSPVLYTTTDLSPTHVCGALMKSLYNPPQRPRHGCGRTVTTIQGQAIMPT
ncbi:hypothetical protein RhiJN_12521 [Ceratobasidium sp. AG-Ba]|nr:hypothetical protein RhiJN_12521 [Ceratobasidium sp. AG-Ba]